MNPICVAYDYCVNRIVYIQFQITVDRFPLSTCISFCHILYCFKIGHSNSFDLCDWIYEFYESYDAYNVQCLLFVFKLLFQIIESNWICYVLLLFQYNIVAPYVEYFLIIVSPKQRWITTNTHTITHMVINYANILDLLSQQKCT